MANDDYDAYPWAPVGYPAEVPSMGLFSASAYSNSAPDHLTEWSEAGAERARRLVSELSNPDTQWRSNPPVHPTVRSRKNLVTGYIRRYNEPGITPSTTNAGTTNLRPNLSAGGVQFNFGFNPSRLGVGWQMSTDAYTQMIQNPEENVTGRIAGPEGQASVDFQVLIDRTAETIEGSMPGVLGDLIVLEYVASPLASGMIEPTPIEMTLGGANSFHITGFIPGMGIEFTHFTEQMVPMRAIVSFTLKRLSRVNSVWVRSDATEHNYLIDRAIAEREAAARRLQDLQDNWMSMDSWSRPLTQNTDRPIQYRSGGPVPQVR